MPEDAFYEPTLTGYSPSQLTRGPWDPGSQHAGPPAALLGREMEALPEAGEFRIARVTFEVVRPVPIAEVTVSACVARPGRRVQMIEASMAGPDGDPVLIARAWRIRTEEVDVSSAPVPETAAMTGPEAAEERPFFPVDDGPGYHTAIEPRFIEGAFTEPGPAKVWIRMRYPLIAGEDPSPLQRVLIVADSGNGVSAALDFRRFLFINVDLSVHLERLPEGEWVGLDAVTRPEPDGTGTSDTVLHDQSGRIGRAQQTLLIAERS